MMKTALHLNPRTLQITGPLGRADISLHDLILLRAFADAENLRLPIEALLTLTGKCSEQLPALQVQLVRLRKKLEQVGAESPTIKAIRGYGYQLCVVLQPDSPSDFQPHSQPNSQPHSPYLAFSKEVQP